MLNIIEINKRNPVKIDIEVTNEDSLFHYTNLKNVQSILRSGSLWISRSDCLEDKSEIIYFYKVLEEVIINLENKSKEIIGLYETEGKLYFQMLDYLKWCLSNKNLERTDYCVYVLSLTENGESVDLLNEYSKEEYINIEFDTKKLLEIDNFKSGGRSISSNYFFTSGKVIYDFKTQIKIIETDILSIYKLAFHSLIKAKMIPVNQTIYENLFQDIMTLIVLKFQMYCQFFKDKKYSFEEEYRIAFILGKDVEEEIAKIREIDNRKIHYLDFSFNANGAIKNINKFSVLGNT